jgi:hypothetical protein
MSSSVKFKPRTPKTPGTPKATQTTRLPDGGIRVEDATVTPEAGKRRPALVEHHPSKKRRSRKLRPGRPGA